MTAAAGPVIEFTRQAAKDALGLLFCNGMSLGMGGSKVLWFEFQLSVVVNNQLVFSAPLMAHEACSI